LRLQRGHKGRQVREEEVFWIKIIGNSETLVNKNLNYEGERGGKNTNNATTFSLQGPRGGKKENERAWIMRLTGSKGMMRSQIKNRVRGVLGKGGRKKRTSHKFSSLSAILP